MMGETSVENDIAVPVQSGVKLGLVELLLQPVKMAVERIKRNRIFFI